MAEKESNARWMVMMVGALAGLGLAGASGNVLGQIFGIVVIGLAILYGTGVIGSEEE